MLKHLVFLSLLACCLLSPTWVMAMPQHLYPTYLTFEGELHKYNNSGSYHTGEYYNATFYIDYYRDATTYYWPDGRPYARNYYAEYVSGNIFGVLKNLKGWGSDYYGVWPGSPGDEPGAGEGYIYFDQFNGEFFNYGKNLSAIFIGDYLDYIVNNGDLVVMHCTSFTETAYPAPVPEPASCLLVGAGLVGAGLLRKRTKA